MKTILLTILILFWSSLGVAQGFRPYLPKVDGEMPDNYGIKILYVTGKEESFEVASHNFTKESGLFEFVTKEDVWNWIPLSSVQRIEFDKRFSKIIAIKEKELQKKEKKSPQKSE